MKLNFWQWIGVILIIGVVIWIIIDRTKGQGTPSGQPSTQPAGRN